MSLMAQVLPCSIMDGKGFFLQKAFLYIDFKEGPQDIQPHHVPSQQKLICCLEAKKKIRIKQMSSSFLQGKESSEHSRVGNWSE